MSDSNGDRREKTGAILEDARLLLRIVVFPIAGNQEEMSGRICPFGFEKIIFTLEEQLGEPYDLLWRFQGHVKQPAGPEESS